MENEDAVNCPVCKKNFNNPFYKKEIIIEQKNLLNKSSSPVYTIGSQFRTLLIIAAIITAIVYFINYDSSSHSNVQSSAYDGSVYQVEQFLKTNLKDPDSYHGIEWSRLNEESGENYKYWIRHKYRAKNSFGGYTIENKIFYLDEDGNVIGVKDF